MSLAKRRELSVYRRVGLRWDAKSRAARRRIEQEGIFRFIGEGTSSRPWIKVLRTEYLRAWNRAAEVMNRSPLLQQLEDGRAANLLRQSLERLIYDDLVAHARDLAQMEQQFERTHGRAMSPHELECCLRTMETQPVPAHTSTPAVRATQLRQVRLNQVMRNLRRQHGSHVNQLQDVWARVAGSEAALETVLEFVDRQRGFAYFRAQSAVSGHRLRTQHGLREALSRELGCTIKRLVCR